MASSTPPPVGASEGFRPRPSPLRLAGFLVTIVGGTLIGVGSILTWATVRFGGESVVKGIDTIEGKIALACAIIVLLGIPAMRGALTRKGRRGWAIAIIVLSLVAAGGALYDAIRKEARLGLPGAEQIAGQISAEAGIPAEKILEQFSEEVETELGPGIPVTIAGGVIGAIGGVLGLIWASTAPLPGVDGGRVTEEESTAAD